MKKEGAVVGNHLTYNNYFELMGIPKDFKIDKHLLEKKYTELQSIYHPDKGNDPSISTEINQAYKILKSDASRAEYMLSLDGYNAYDKKDIPSDLLQQIFILRDELSEINDFSSLEDFENLVEEKNNVLLEDFNTNYNAKDYEKAVVNAIYIRYFEKIFSEISEKKLLLIEGI